MPAEQLDSTAAVFELLNRVGDQKFGYGWKEMVNRGLNRASGYVNRDMAKGTMRLATLFEVMEILGEEPGRFFAEIFGTGDPICQSPDLAVPAPQDPKLAKVLPTLTFDEETTRPDFDSQIVAGIQERKKSAPEIAREMAFATLILVANGALPKNITFPVLIEVGRITVRMNRLPHARGCFQTIYEKAKKLDCDLIVAEVLLRSTSLVIRETANPRLALRIANNALVAFTDLGCKKGVGQALVKRSWYQHQLGLHDRAESSLRIAIDFLPESDCFFASAHHTLGLLMFERKDFEAAEEHLGIAKQFADGNPELEGNIMWILAGIAREQGDFRKAAEAFEFSRKVMAPVAPVQSAMVSLEFSHFLLKNGKNKRAIEVTSGMASLLGPLSGYPQIQVIVLNLLRNKLSAGITETKLLKAFSDIREGVAHQAKLG